MNPVDLLPSQLYGHEVTGVPRPPWWRPFARRRWDRTVEAARLIQAKAADRALSVLEREDVFWHRFFGS